MLLGEERFPISQSACLESSEAAAGCVAAFSADQYTAGLARKTGSGSRHQDRWWSNPYHRERAHHRAVVMSNVSGRDLGSFVKDCKISSRREDVAASWLPAGMGRSVRKPAARSATTSDRLSCVAAHHLCAAFRNLPECEADVSYSFHRPLALVGGVAALWLRGINLNLSACVGFIALFGIAVLNGVVMVSHINSLRKDGKEVEDAVHQGALDRLRPVVITALVASLGFIPMALSTSRGAEVEKPLATVVIEASSLQPSLPFMCCRSCTPGSAKTFKGGEAF